MMRWVTQPHLCIPLRSSEPTSCVQTQSLCEWHLDALIADMSEELLLVKASPLPNVLVQHVLLHNSLCLDINLDLCLEETVLVPSFPHTVPFNLSIPATLASLLLPLMIISLCRFPLTSVDPCSLLQFPAIVRTSGLF